MRRLADRRPVRPEPAKLLRTAFAQVPMKLPGLNQTAILEVDTDASKYSPRFPGKAVEVFGLIASRHVEVLRVDLRS